MLKSERIIFLDIMRWFILATVIGVVVGVADAAFLMLLDFTSLKTSSVPYHYFSLPIVFVVVGFLAKGISPENADYTTNAVIDRINSNQKVSLISAVKAFFLPVITISAGGSAGKEAPCADVGAGIASWFASILKMSVSDTRKLMICGVSAGFAGVFGVPISGAIFGLEVLWVGHIFYEVMFPAFIAGITAFQVTSALGVEYVYHPMSFVPVFSESFFLKVVVAGVLFGLTSILFIEVMKFCKIIARYIARKVGPIWLALLGGSVLVAVGYFISTDYLGLGMDHTENLLAGYDSGKPFGFLLKMITAGITLAAGGVGGIVTPILFVGAEAGNMISAFLEVDPATMTALGLVALLAGTTNAPLAASIMSVELFGPQIAPYAAVACVISFLMTGERSVFSKQKVSFIKDMAFDSQSEKTAMPIVSSKRRRPKKAALMKLVRHLLPDQHHNKDK